MINLTPNVVAALNTVLPTHYELVLNGGTKVPCISYQERSNVETEQGDTIGYSRVSYTVKVWGYDLEELNRYAEQIDVIMRNMGFKRVSMNELHSYQTNIIQKILAYEILALEEY